MTAEEFVKRIRESAQKDADGWQKAEEDGEIDEIRYRYHLGKEQPKND